MGITDKDLTMKKHKVLFSLISFCAFILVFASGFYLKMNADSLSKAQSLAWGGIFVVSALTFARGIRYLGQS